MRVYIQQHFSRNNNVLRVRIGVEPEVTRYTYGFSTRYREDIGYASLELPEDDVEFSRNGIAVSRIRVGGEWYTASEFARANEYPKFNKEV